MWHLQVYGCVIDSCDIQYSLLLGVLCDITVKPCLVVQWIFPFSTTVGRADSYSTLRLQFQLADVLPTQHTYQRIRPFPIQTQVIICILCMHKSVYIYRVCVCAFGTHNTSVRQIVFMTRILASAHTYESTHLLKISPTITPQLQTWDSV